MKYARIYRQNLISLRCALENAQELAVCCGQMGTHIVDNLEEMINQTQAMIRSIEAILREHAKEAQSANENV